jgi:hypothetical protein
VRVKGINPTQLGDLRSKGAVATHITPWGMHMQKWPRPRGKAKQGYDLYRQIEFQIAAQLAKNPEPIEFQTALNLVKGSTWTYRDLKMRAIYGYAYTITLEDGRTYKPQRSMTSNPLYWLDLIDDTPGAIVFRSDIGWVGLDPPSFQPALLQYSGGFNLEWVHPPSSGPGAPDYLPPLAASFGTLINSPTLTDSDLGLGIEGASNANKAYLALNAWPAAASTLIVRTIGNNFFTTSHGIGLATYNSGNGRCMQHGAIVQNQAGAAGMIMDSYKWTTTTSAPSTQGGGASFTDTDMWCKLALNTGSPRWVFSASLDGVTWRVINQDDGFIGTPTHFGIGAFARSTAVNVRGAFPYYKLTSP